MSRIDEAREFIPVRIAVLTVSDTRGPADDRSGDTLVDRLENAGHRLAARAIVQDDREMIAGKLREWIANPDVDAVITTGGTGLTGRDVTVEAHRDVYEKEIHAFGTVFTMVSMQKIGTSAVQSRATAGRRHLSFRTSGQPRRLQGRLGRNSRTAARLSPPALQLRGDHAAARRAYAPQVAQGACNGLHFATILRLVIARPRPISEGA